MKAVNRQLVAMTSHEVKELSLEDIKKLSESASRYYIIVSQQFWWKQNQIKVQILNLEMNT